MQYSNEEEFKKKYLKYKAKYLELKNLLEGGIPKKKSQVNCKTIYAKSDCESKGCSWELADLQNAKAGYTCRPY